MENTNRDTANVAQQNEWQDAGRDASQADTTSEQISEPLGADVPRYGTDKFDERLNVMVSNDDPDEDEEDDDDDTSADEEDDAASDWGHVDPAESNSPFPDSNEPSAPGSAV